MITHTVFSIVAKNMNSADYIGTGATLRRQPSMVATLTSCVFLFQNNSAQIHINTRLSEKKNQNLSLYTCTKATRWISVKFLSDYFGMNFSQVQVGLFFTKVSPSV